MANRIQIDITANDNASPVFQKIQSAANGVGKTTQEAAEGGLDQFSNGLLRGVAGGVLFANGATVIGEKTAEIAKALIEDGLALQTNQAQLEAWGGVSTTTSANITRAFVAQSGSVRESASEQIGALAEVAPRLELVSGHTLTVAEATKEMSAATDLADASGQKLTTTTGALASIQTTYKLSTDQAKQAAGELLAITELTGAPMEEVAATVGRLHDRFGSATPNIHDMGVLLTQLQEQGVSGSRGLLAVSSATATLLSDAPEVRNQLQLLKIDLFNADGSAKPFTEDLRNIAAATVGMTDAQREAVEKNLFSASGAAVLDRVIKDYAVDYPKATAAVQAHSNITEQADIRNRTATAGWEKAGAAVKNAAGEVDLWVGSNGELLKQLATHLPVTFLGTATLEAMGAAKAFEILHPDLSKTIDLMERTGSRIAETMHTEETAVSSSVGAQTLSLEQYQTAQKLAAKTVSDTADAEVLSITRGVEDQTRILSRGAEDQVTVIQRSAQAQVLEVSRGAQAQATAVTRAAEDQSLQVQRAAQQQTITITRQAEDQSLQVQRIAQEQVTAVGRAAEDQSTQVSRAGQTQATAVQRSAEQQSVAVQRAAEQQSVAVVRQAEAQAMQVTRAAESQNIAVSRSAEDTTTGISRSAQAQATAVGRAAEDQIAAMKRVVQQHSEMATAMRSFDFSGLFGDPSGAAQDQIQQLQRGAEDAATTQSRAVQDQLTRMRQAGASSDQLLAVQRAAEDAARAVQRSVADQAAAIQKQAENAVKTQQNQDTTMKGLREASLTSAVEDNSTANEQITVGIRRAAEDQITAIKQSAEDRSTVVKRGAEDQVRFNSQGAQDQTTAIRNGAQDQTTAIRNGAQDETTVIRNAAQDQVTLIQNRVTDETTAIQRGAVDHVRAITDDAQNQTIAIQREAQNHVLAVQQDAQDQTTVIRNAAQDHVTAIQDDAQNQTIAIQNGAADHARAVERDMQDQATAIQRGGQDKVTAVKANAQAELDAIAAMGPEALQKSYDLGTTIDQGIAQGITANSPIIQAAAASAIKAAITAGKDAAEAHSPSAVAASEIGLPIAQGIAGGITSGTSTVNDAITNLVGGALSTAGGAFQNILGGLGKGGSGGGGAMGTGGTGPTQSPAEAKTIGNFLQKWAGQNTGTANFDLVAWQRAAIAAGLYTAQQVMADRARAGLPLVAFSGGGVLPENIIGMGISSGQRYSLHANERVLSPAQTQAYDAGGAQPNIILILDGEDVTKHVTVRMETARRAELASLGAA